MGISAGKSWFAMPDISTISTKPTAKIDSVVNVTVVKVISDWKLKFGRLF